MAKVSLKIDLRSKLKDGTCPIKLYVNHRDIDFFIHTGISIDSDQWTGDQDAPTGVRRYDAPLIQMLTRARATIYQLRADGKLNDLDKQGLKSLLLHEPKEQPVASIKNTKPLLKDMFAQFTEHSVKTATRGVYNHTLDKIGKSHDLEILTFEDITLPWLRAWENTLRADGLAINTISIHFRNLRAIFNRAIDDEVISQSCYPFRKFKIKSERTKKRALTIEQLCILRDYDCQEHQRKYRDIFILMLYLLGINSVDLFDLKEISNGRIEFRRAKTGRLYSIKVEPEAMNIIQQYKGKNYLIDVCDTYKNYSDFRKRMNKNLQEIGPMELVSNKAKDPLYVKKNKKHVTSLFPDLTTYWARHTWATIAAGLDIPKETIAAALGHGGNSVTDIYIDFDNKKVDQANRLVIDYINNADNYNSMPPRVL